MSKKLVVHETDFDSVSLEGRQVVWMMTPETAGTEHASVCVVSVDPGRKAKPGHSHPLGEEIIYIVQGKGKVKIGDYVSDIRPGSLMQFPKGVPHMLFNTGTEQLKGVCFYGPEAVAVGYEYFEDMDF